MAGVEMVPSEYGYVALVIVLSAFLNFWMSSQVSKARKKYVYIFRFIFIHLFSFLFFSVL